MNFRLKCFGYHLLISLLIAVLTLFIVFHLWYPSPLDEALGVADIFLLLLCIDVIIGPLLTLVVAQHGKKSLKMDLAVIGILQMLALSYGLYIVAQGRPAWLVYNNNRFEIVQAYEAVPSPDSANNELPLSFTGPIWGAVIEPLPASVKRSEAFYQQAFLQGYESALAEGRINSMPVEVLRRFNKADEVDRVLGLYPQAKGFIPITGKEKSMVVLVDDSIGELIAIVDLSPW